MTLRLLGMLPVFAAVTLLAFTTPAPADEFTADCEHPVTTMDVQLCGARAYEAADALLNAAYRNAQSGMNARQKELFVEAQRAWIAWRDKECIAEAAEGEGGSGHSALWVECLTRLTKRRTEQLKAYMD